MRKSNLLEIGKIVRTHGIKGYVKVNSYLDGVNFSIFKHVFIGDDQEEAKILSVSKLNNDAFSVKFDIIPDIDTAERFKNKSVYIDRQEYADFKDKIYLSDLINCPVFDETGAELGRLVDFNEYGASVVLEIKCGAVSYSIPFVEEIIKYDEKKAGFQINRQTFLDVRV